jgi:chromosomal replication initiator protein
MSPYIVPGIRRSDIKTVRYRGMDFYKQLVSEYFGVPISKLDEKTRKREIVMARQIAMYLLYKNEQYSLKKIGEAFGGRDHTTVIHSKDLVMDLMYSDEKYRNDVLWLENEVERIGSTGQVLVA